MYCKGNLSFKHCSWRPDSFVHGTMEIRQSISIANYRHALYTHFFVINIALRMYIALHKHCFSGCSSENAIPILFVLNNQYY